MFIRSWRGMLAACTVAAVSLSAAAEEGRRLEPGTMAARMAACTACHGEQGRAGTDGYYPRIAGKPAEYLYNQLAHFRDGRRQYRPMQLLLENLPDAYLRDIADWFSAQQPPYAPPAPSRLGAAVLARGERLVREGDAARGLPACIACHGASMTGVAPAIPGLLGLPHDYVSAQVGAWVNGLRRAAAPDCMADVSRRMAPEDVAAVAAWLSSQPVPHAAAPQPLPGRLPMACGSQPGGEGAR